MELLDGETLFDALQANDQGIIPVQYILQRRISWILQIKDGLCHVHEAGYLFVDMKPSNVMFKGPARIDVMIIDFGSAKVINNLEVHTTSGQSAKSHFIGTPIFTAVEIMTGQTRRIGLASDTYPWAVTAMCALSMSNDAETLVDEFLDNPAFMESCNDGWDRTRCVKLFQKCLISDGLKRCRLEDISAEEIRGIAVAGADDGASKHKRKLDPVNPHSPGRHKVCIVFPHCFCPFLLDFSDRS